MKKQFHIPAAVTPMTTRQVIGIGSVNKMRYNYKGRDYVDVLAPNRRKLSRRSVHASAKAHVLDWTECVLISSTGKILDAMDNDSVGGNYDAENI